MYGTKIKNQTPVYVFDFDGTLVDSMPVAVKIVLSLLDEKGIAYGEDIVQTLTPLGFKGIAKYYEEILGVPMPQEEIFRWFIDKLTVAYAEEICLKPTARETLFALRARGTRLCVLTGSPHAFTDPCLKREGVYDLFERIWSAEEFSLAKSDTRIYEAVAKEMGVAVEDLTVVDDGLLVLRTAKKAGARTVGAYDRCSATEEELSAASDTWVRTLAELL